MSTPPLELTHILAMRVVSEKLRMDDLKHLAGIATEGEEPANRARFEGRISGRLAWAAEVVHNSDSWQAWVDGAADADFLVDELVSLLMTRLLRASGLDSGTFQAAEKLVAELTSLTGVPRLVLGHTQESESMDYTRAKVSLRFPGSRVWDLPIVSHEFGHHAVKELPNIEPALRANRPLVQLSTVVVEALGDERVGADRAERHAQEFLADCVATIACGPTYPIACLCLRVPRGKDAASATPSHPSWRDRVGVMREVLDALTDQTSQGRYTEQRRTVVDLLAAKLFDDLPGPGGAGEEAARGTVKRVLQHCPDLVYRDADKAIEVAERLGRGQAEPPPGASVRAVLDGAWRWRLAQPSRTNDPVVGALAARYCHEVGQ